MESAPGPQTVFLFVFLITLGDSDFNEMCGELQVELGTIIYFVLKHGNVSPKHGTSFTIRSKNWFEGAQGGFFLKLGFQASFSGKEQPEFTSVIFNGKELIIK